MRIVRIDDFIADSRIEEIQLPVFLNGASGEAAILIRAGGWIEGESLVFPCDQIPAHCMAPVHGPPARLVGKILVEKVVVSLVVNKAVRIVYPVVRCF